jgi:hypothetical protein
MQAKCPSGHPFITGTIAATIPQKASGIAMEVGAFQANVIGIYCTQCGHVYGVTLFE